MSSLSFIAGKDELCARPSPAAARKNESPIAHSRSAPAACIDPCGSMLEYITKSVQFVNMDDFQRPAML